MEELHHWPYTAERNNTPPLRLSASTNGQGTQIVGSTLAAAGDAHAQGESSQRVFLSSSHEIAAALEVALQHEEDLVVDTEAFVVGNPRASEAKFLAWAGAVHLTGRHPLKEWHQPAPRQGAQVRSKAWRTS